MPTFFVHHKISLNVTVHLSILLSIIILTIFWQVYINHRCFFLVYINLLFNFMLKACKKFTYLPSIIKNAAKLGCYLHGFLDSCIPSILEGSFECQVFHPHMEKVFQAREFARPLINKLHAHRSVNNHHFPKH